MERWAGKVAVVTGASAGVGLSIVEYLVDAEMIVIGLARREHRLAQLKEQLKTDKGQFHYYKCDVSDLDSIKSVFSEIFSKFGRVDVLVNNAGILKYCKLLTEDNESDLEKVVQTNLMGSIYCTKQVYNIMKGMNEECHIININSLVGHYIPLINSVAHCYNIYPSTKFALRAAAEVLRQELLEDTNFRISNISPGLVKTEINHASGNPLADRIMSTKEILAPEDVAKTVKFVLEMPKYVQISELTVIPVGQRF